MLASFITWLHWDSLRRMPIIQQASRFRSKQGVRNVKKFLYNSFAFSEISLNCILKDGDLQWREKAILKDFLWWWWWWWWCWSLNLFFISKIRTTTFERIDLRDLQEHGLFHSTWLKNLFYGRNSWMLVWSWFLILLKRIFIKKLV